MIFDNLKNIIKEKFNKPDKKEWLDKLVENLEAQSLDEVNLRFKIMGLKSKGFVIKIEGLYAFVSFYHMPWKYSDVNYWTPIAPKLIGKVFYCKVHSIKKDPLLSIVVNGEIPQFKNMELQIGERYKGIIIEKIKGGLLVETGYHFDWKCGSFVGFLHQSKFEFAKSYLSCSVGDEIEVVYQGLNEKGQLVYTQTGEVFDWKNEIPQRLVGQAVLVHVVREEIEEGTKFFRKLLVNGKYNGRIVAEKNDSFFKSKNKAKSAENNLKNGEIIHCEVIGFEEKVRILLLKWMAELDSELIENGFAAYNERAKGTGKAKDK